MLLLLTNNNIFYKRTFTLKNINYLLVTISGRDKTKGQGYGGNSIKLTIKQH